jgi:alcohol dehydrogenase YqhD (iron-dependent ADH family)
MEDFAFRGHTAVVFGRGKVKEAGKEIRNAGGKRVLLHYGQGSIKKSGLHRTVVASLEKEGIAVVELSGVVPNPRLSLVRKGIALCRENSVDFILAVGGGSVIDSAKAIAVGVPYAGDVWDFSCKQVTPRTALPVGVILTIPAAGSETSQYAVITNDEGPYPLKRDAVYANNEVIRPVLAILDPELTLDLPPYQTACGIVDIMSHVIERYFTAVKNVDFTDRLCEATLKAVIENGRLVMEEPRNYDARAEIMWAGSVAHNDLLGTGRAGDWSSHAIEHELSAVYDITHGAGLAIVLPAWARYVHGFAVDRFAQFAVRVWNVEYDFARPARTAMEGIARMERFFNDLGLPTRLSEVKIGPERFREMAEKSEKRGSIRKLDVNDVQRILETALSR